MTTAVRRAGDCPSCADERSAGAQFCEVCGQPLDPAGDEAAPRDLASLGSVPASGTAGPSGAGGLAMTGATAPADGAGTSADCPACGAADAVGDDGYCVHCGMLAARPRDHTETAVAGAGAVSDRGRRHHRNEDAMWLTGHRSSTSTVIDVVVCDGVSSSFDPDVASQVAADTAGALLAATPTVAGSGSTPGTSLPDDSMPTAGAGPDGETAVEPNDETGPDDETGALLAAAIVAAGAAVAALAGSGDPRRIVSNPACTIVAARVRDADIGYGWVGDSRAYWIDADGPAWQLTEDDSWATHAIREGADPQQAFADNRAHAITAWLGADAGPVAPRTGRFTVTRAGHLLLCSDGLWNYLTEPSAFADTVREHLRAAAGSPQPVLAAARSLTAFANEAGGSDNITVVIVEVPVGAPDGGHGDGQ